MLPAFKLNGNLLARVAQSGGDQKSPFAGNKSHARKI
jgi:hypothetical protein